MNAVDYFSNKYSGIAPKNSNLTKAKAAKNDEFYTQYSDIEAELSHYEVKHFADRVVYLPCDDWHFSQFVKYFENNFTRLQLKVLVATGINFTGAGYYYKKTSEGVTTGVLEGNGDFRSDACRQLMREADIIVTNPPFSLFREFIAQIMEFRKKFLVVGNMNAIAYRDFFINLRDNKVWLGVRNLNKDMYFGVPRDYAEILESDKKEGSAYKRIDGVVMGRLASACWFTNIEHSKRHEPLEFNTQCTYSPDRYTQYDNYDAINISKVKEIPFDYFGVMGVPVTYMGSYCPDQFEIVGLLAGNIQGLAGIPSKTGKDGPYINGKIVYNRILIKRKTIPVEPE